MCGTLYRRVLALYSRIGSRRFTGVGDENVSIAFGFTIEWLVHDPIAKPKALCVGCEKLRGRGEFFTLLIIVELEFHCEISAQTCF